MIEFFSELQVPTTTFQSKSIAVNKYGKPMMFKRKEVVEIEKYMAWNFKKYAPAQAIEGPIKLMVCFYFPYLQTDLKKKNLPPSMPCTRKPDLDNSAKIVLDVMTRLGFWHNDSQIYSLCLSKRNAFKTGIFVRVEDMKK